MVTKVDKRHLFVWLTKRICKTLDVSAKHKSDNTFVLTVGKNSVDLPYDYWTEWTIGEIIDYVKEVIL